MDTRGVEEAITRGIEGGWLVVGCGYCDERMTRAREQAIDPMSIMMPRHKASDRCESGKHPHCTCDTCF